MQAWAVEFANEEAGAEFKALPVDMQAKLQRAFRLVEARGLSALVMPLA